MEVSKHDENYLINSMGLTKKQIKEMLPSEIEKYCDNIIKQRIKERGMFNPKSDNQSDNEIIKKSD